MENSKGVYITTKKDNSKSYRASITYKGKHISLGSYSDYKLACNVYNEARDILDNTAQTLGSYNIHHIPFLKFITLVNFRDNGIYFATPIYLRKQYFEYYLNENRILKFDRDDLFFYSAHKILSKGGYLFVNDYGSQYKLLSRYGVRPFAVYGRDYVMINSDRDDYRYSNIKIINQYTGVTKRSSGGSTLYRAAIHVNGNLVIGDYQTETEAAIAYNKAADLITSKGLQKNYIKNYICGITNERYNEIYDKLKVSKRVSNFSINDTSSS